MKRADREAINKAKSKYEVFYAKFQHDKKCSNFLLRQQCQLDKIGSNSSIFEFEQSFRYYTQLFYKQSSVKLQLNNVPLTTFILGTGVRQGNFLSPDLLIVYMEMLLNFLHTKLPHLGIQSKSIRIWQLCMRMIVWACFNI